MHVGVYLRRLGSTVATGRGMVSGNSRVAAGQAREGRVAGVAVQQVGQGW